MSPCFGSHTNPFCDQLTIQNGASILGRTIPNLLADEFGPINVILCTSFATGVMVFALLGIKSVAGVAVFAVLYGFFSGGGLSFGVLFLRVCD